MDLHTPRWSNGTCPFVQQIRHLEKGAYTKVVLGAPHVFKVGESVRLSFPDCPELEELSGKATQVMAASFDSIRIGLNSETSPFKDFPSKFSIQGAQIILRREE